MWHVIVDQISAMGGRQSYQSREDSHTLSDAVDDALERAGLMRAEVGQYQITATHTPDA